MAPCEKPCTWWLIVLGAFLALLVLAGLLTWGLSAHHNVTTRINAITGAIATTFDFGRLSVLSTPATPVFIPASFMTPGVYYPMLVAPTTNRSVTNNTTKFDLSSATLPSVVFYTPNFAASPTGHVTVTGAITFTGALITINNLIIYLRAAIAWSTDLIALTNPTIGSEISIRMDVSGGEVLFGESIPFSFDFTAANFTGQIAIFGVLMLDPSGVIDPATTKSGTQAVTIVVQEVPGVVKTAP